MPEPVTVSSIHPNHNHSSDSNSISASNTKQQDHHHPHHNHPHHHHHHHDSTDKVADSIHNSSTTNNRSDSPSSNSSSTDHDLAQYSEDLTNSRHQTETTQATSTNHSTSSLIYEGQAQEDSDPSGPFEGPEKLLEIWFCQDQHSLPSGCLADTFSILDKNVGSSPQRAGKPIQRKGLRAVPRAEWEKALDLVKCKVLSTLQGDEVDAYLLSESSMFIFPHKLILKTCGTTTLLLGLERLLRLSRWGIFGIKDVVLSSSPRSKNSSKPSPTEDQDSLRCLSHQTDPNSSPASSLMGEDFRSLGSIAQRIFYSRKSFMFPERQKGPHRDWMLEVGVLDGFFKNGSAYTVGKMNGDHWLLYMSCPMDCNSTTKSIDSPNPSEDRGKLTIERPIKLPSPSIKPDQDQTLEILMTHLSNQSCNRFYFPPPTEITGETISLEHASSSLNPQISQDLRNLQVQEKEAEAEAGTMDRGHNLGFNLSKEVGLESLFQNTMLDAFAFDPCGYSANAIVPKSSQDFIEKNGFENSQGYWTVHVTPEEDSSYASFETNISLRDLTERSTKGGNQESNLVRDLPSLIEKIISIFSPGKMSITLFLSTCQDDEDDGNAESQADLDGEKLHKLQLKGYNKTVRIAYEFEGYDLVFVSFEKK